MVIKVTLVMLTADDAARPTASGFGPIFLMDLKDVPKPTLAIADASMYPDTSLT